MTDPIRVAIVRAGLVDHIEMAPPGFMPPEGAKAIPSTSANIGDHFDGERFTPAPISTAPEDFIGRVNLLRDGRTRLDYEIDVGEGVVVTTDLRGPTRDSIAMLRRWGEVNPTAVREWKKGGTRTPMTGAQFVKMSIVVDTCILNLFEKAGEIIDNINSSNRAYWTEDDVINAFNSVLPPIAS